MDPYADLPSGQRVRWLTRLACLWAAALLGRLIYLQVIAHANYREQAFNQQMRRREVKPPRGFIFDRNGRPLAMSLPVETITVNPKQLPDTRLAAHLLSSVLELDAEELRAKLDGAVANRRGYLIVAKNVDAHKAGRLRNLGVDWISFESEGVRKYPNGTLAAHVLGGVDFEERGNAGVERQFEDDLGGYPGYEWVVTDVKRRGYESTMETAPQTGKSLYLTIDRRIQHAADAAVRRAVIDNDCQSGTAVVMDPYRGDILAIANFPTYDPNTPPRPNEDPAARKNLAVGDPFEPGSVFKVFTIAAAIEEGVVRPDTPIDCQNGIMRMAGRVIHEAKGGYGVLTVEDVLAKSSNIGAIKIGQRLSDAKLHEYLLRFGFNRSTGIDLPGESSGLIFRLKRWHPASIGSVAMGHEVLTTSVQLAQAVSVIANNGLLVPPRLIVNDPPPGVTARSMIQPVSVAEPRRVIRPETAITMRQMMEAVVLRGTGKSARLDGYTSGGKTGTAQLFDKTTQRYTHLYNASFMGFAPVTNPAIVVVVTLNGSAKYGGVIAAPVFKEIAQTALRVMNVPQDNFTPPPDEPTPAPAADLAMVPLSSSDAARLHAAMDAERQATAVTQIATGPAAPDFLGKPVRTVIEEAASRGVRVELIGIGLARQQEPAPGIRLMTGQRVKVIFAH